MRYVAQGTLAFGFEFAHARILLVEDDAINREVVLEALCHSGLVIETAVNGQEGPGPRQPARLGLLLVDIDADDGWPAHHHAIRATAEMSVSFHHLALTASN